MPKKCVTPSPLAYHSQIARSSPFVASDAANLVQRARRRLQYSQLPIRCANAKRSTQTPCRLASSLKKFPVKSPKDSALGTDKRRSLSMTDLSPCALVAVGEFESADLRSLDSGSTSAHLDDGSARRADDGSSTEGCCSALATWVSLNSREARESRATSLVCRALAVNAWRRKREEVLELRHDIQGLGQQVDQLQLQIVVLRRLLDKENERVAALAGDLHKAKAHADELTKERDQLRIEKETAESAAQRQRDISDEQSVSVENLRNELRTARDQIDALDKQIARDREKLVKLREDKKLLLEKVEACEAIATERAERADTAELSLEDMQVQLATQIALTNSLQEELQRFAKILNVKEAEKSELEGMLRKLEEENIEIEERLRMSENAGRLLTLRAADLETQLFEQAAKLKRIEDTYNAQMSELNHLREQVFHRTRQTGWSSKVLQLAGSFVRAPRVIFRTLSFFSTAIPVIL
ncbi:uncharacterized protein LOC131663569 [Phymastichus coffea]|uniref:uncharacterized protein LOC131663569 n=1 Tax=Phymastichus coffea TaxID=108790 RepID=UPI00273ADC02|nr:uncharacterized protein LOC131663569 [Phymastichus coffea]